MSRRSSAAHARKPAARRPAAQPRPARPHPVTPPRPAPVAPVAERILNIGCGPASRWIPDTDGIDMLDFGQKYVGDFLTTPVEGEYDVIFCHHVVEHVPDTIALFDRIGDILRPGGVVDIRVPVLPHMEAFQDPTHVKFIPGEVFFAYFTAHSPAGHCYSKHEFTILGSAKDRFDWELHIVLEKVAVVAPKARDAAAAVPSLVG